jgi:ligand-binding sensor domain-containing protein/signal transduction histidine kinase
MKAHCKFFTPVLLLLLVKVCLSQAQQIVFNYVPTPRGSIMPGNYHGMQDPQGYMWFATRNGLYRYDGYSYVSYLNDPLNSNSLAGNYVETFCIGRNGMIWIGTDGVDCLDPSTRIFKHFRHKPNDNNSLSSNKVLAILEDKEGIIWAGTENGLNRLDPKSQIITRYQHTPNDSTSLSNNEVRAIYEDRQGTLWIGTGFPFSANRNKDGGLNRMDKKSGSFIRYLHDPKNAYSLIDNRVRAIFEDSRGTFWIGTAGDGLHIMNREKGTFERQRYDPTHPEKLSRPEQKKTEIWAEDHITFIIEDVTGAIWIGTFGNGLNRYDPKTKKVKHFPNFEDKESGVKTGIAWWACTSREGELWLGYFEGTFRLDPLQQRLAYFPTVDAVYSIYQDTSSGLWYGGDSGLVLKDRITGIKHHYVHDPRNPISISETIVISIYKDRKDELWVGTYDGLNRFDRNTGTFVRYFPYPDDGSILDPNVVECIYEDRADNFWIGTFHSGLHLMNRKTGTFTHYRNNPRDSNSLSTNQIKRIYEDRYGNLWVGTYFGGLNLFNSETGKVQRFLYGNSVNCLLEDAEGILWVGTSNGLYRSNPGMKSFSRYIDPGTDMAGAIVITGILEDNANNLWINTSIGILKLNHQRNEIVIYGQIHGVNVGFNEEAAAGSFKGENGELFFGDRNGYYSFFPEQLSRKTEPPQIVISEFRLADKLIITMGNGSPLKQPLAQTNEIRLKHNQNDFSFNFAGIHYNSPKENRHLFMLEGLDDKWHKANEEKTAYYYHVPPGNYTFRIKAANSNGVWAEKNIAVIIGLPWWRTWWAYLIYGSGLAIVVWMFAWYRSRWLKAENLNLEEKVYKRTNELEQSLEERYRLSKKVESQQALLNERLRISRELHDDIGSTLGSISIYSEVAKKRTGKNENTTEVLSKIGFASRELIDKMSDIVWSLIPGNENFEQLQNRMMAFVTMILTPRNILYDFIIDEGLKKMQLKSEQSKNIFLIFKEALYNMVKYADCKKAVIEFRLQKDDLVMIIQDDGKGFDAYRTAAIERVSAGEYVGGNGIKNMQARADDMMAKLCINSKIDEGTTVELTLRL